MLVNKDLCTYIGVYFRSPAQVKSVLNLMVKLLASGHQSFIKLARNILRHDNMEAVFQWKVN